MMGHCEQVSDGNRAPTHLAAAKAVQRPKSKQDRLGQAEGKIWKGTCPHAHRQAPGWRDHQLQVRLLSPRYGQTGQCRVAVTGRCTLQCPEKPHIATTQPRLTVTPVREMLRSQGRPGLNVSAHHRAPAGVLVLKGLAIERKISRNVKRMDDQQQKKDPGNQGPRGLGNALPSSTRAELRLPPGLWPA